MKSMGSVGRAALAVILVAAGWVGVGRSDARAQAAQGRPVAGPLQQVPSFRAGVEMVSLNVTVADPAGRFVTDIPPEQFTVFEDGVKQDVTFFARTSLPIALSLLLDSSASMEDRLGTAQEAAIGFVRSLRGHDLAELIDFDREVRVLQGFTGDRETLEQAIRRTTAGGSTSLYNAIYISLKELKKVRAASEQDIRRQAVVVLSDGEDTSSLVPQDQVFDLAKRSETAIYAIGLRTKDELLSRGFSEADFFLRKLAQDTGGRAFFPARIEDLAGVYSQIADELASQYSLGYVSKNTKRDGAWRRIVVRVARENTTVRTKQGYYGPK